MRDYLDAIRRRVVVYDGGMGATLEQFELTQEDYGGLRASATRRSSSTGPMSSRASTARCSRRAPK